MVSQYIADTKANILIRQLTLPAAGAKVFNKLQQNNLGKKLKTYDCNHIHEEEDIHFTEDTEGMEYDEAWIFHFAGRRR